MRFALSTLGRLVHPFSTTVKSASHPGPEPGGSQHPSIEPLHVERAHAVVHPVHLRTSDLRRRTTFVNTVRDIHAPTTSGD